MSLISAEQADILRYSKNIVDGIETLNFPGIFGKGSSERVIETPWVAHHARECKEVLDAGFTFASFEYLGLLLHLKENHSVNITGLDIVSPVKVSSRYPSEWLSSILSVPVLIGDARSVNLENSKYDLVTCISTIEHIGFDEPASTVSGSAFERKSRIDEVIKVRDSKTNFKVLETFRNTLKIGGKCLISVPMGKGGAAILQDSLGLYCAQWEYETSSWREILSHNGFSLIEHRYFGLFDDGWMEVRSPDELTQKSSSLKPHAEGCAVCVLKKK